MVANFRSFEVTSLKGLSTASTRHADSWNVSLLGLPDASPEGPLAPGDDTVGEHVISYEEFHAYGTTAWYAENLPGGARRKRYRYTGKERDDESGLAYHGARYYAAWLGRWERPDPAGMVDGPNRWAYCRGNPVGGRDPTGMETLLTDQVIRDNNGNEVVNSQATASRPANDVDDLVTVYDREEGFWDRGVGKGLAFVGGLVVGAATSIAVAAGAAALIAAAPVVGTILVVAAAAVGAGALIYSVVTDDDFGGKIERLLTGEASASEYFGAGFFLGGFAGATPAAGPAVQAGKRAGIGARVAFEIATADVATTTAQANVIGRDVGSFTPKVTSPKLENIIGNLYKGVKNTNQLGTGTTADAVRYELATGAPVGGRFHSTKARESIQALKNWLRKNPDASDSDRQVALSLIEDLEGALARR